jgi:hypothetical protein
MIIEQAVLNQLMATPAVTVIIGQRAYYVRAIQDVTAPYVVIQSISNIPVKPNMAAASGKTASRLQLSIFANTHKECNDVADAVKTALDGFKGTLGGVGGVPVGGCFLENANDLSVEDSLTLYGVGVDYILHY